MKRLLNARCEYSAAPAARRVLADELEVRRGRQHRDEEGAAEREPGCSADSCPRRRPSARRCPCRACRRSRGTAAARGPMARCSPGPPAADEFLHQSSSSRHASKIRCAARRLRGIYFCRESAMRTRRNSPVRAARAAARRAAPMRITASRRISTSTSPSTFRAPSPSTRRAIRTATCTSRPSTRTARRRSTSASRTASRSSHATASRRRC